jgi:hypothetical protein
MGNIIWDSKHEMRAGKFPPSHPVGGKGFGAAPDGQMGDGQNIVAFRERGYWASCFPEGDGVTWKPLNSQSDAQCLSDIREIFGWDAKWDKSVAAIAKAGAA